MPVTTKDGGSSPGWEWKCIFSFGSWDGWTEGGSGISSSCATTKWKLNPWRPAAESIAPDTVTVSPEMNGALGTKLAPSPCEYARSRPPWTPLSEPRTSIADSDEGVAPKRLIWVRGRAS